MKFKCFFSLFLIICTIFSGIIPNSGNISYQFYDSLVEFVEIENEEPNEVESEQLSSFIISLLDNLFLNNQIHQSETTINYGICLRQPLPPPELS